MVGREEYIELCRKVVNEFIVNNRNRILDLKFYSERVVFPITIGISIFEQYVVQMVWDRPTGKCIIDGLYDGEPFTLDLGEIMPKITPSTMPILFLIVGKDEEKNDIPDSGIN